MMSSDSFGISGSNAPAISEKIVASTLNAIQQLLPENKIQQVYTEEGEGVIHIGFLSSTKILSLNRNVHASAESALRLGSVALCFAARQ
jgi:hypothetical protein